jgi:hypothetical protein
MKPSDLIGKDDHKALAAVTLALVGLRETLVALSNTAGTSADPVVKSFAPILASKTDALDYATTALAGRIGWSITSDGRLGHGASVPSDVADAVARWATRGRKDPVA